MFLKSLSIRGFKSFPDRTELLFEPGVTIVVGPNGSGKSNIVDAISWVLGEQGPRSLRGGKMEDVIFAGSRLRPALGMAEVSLTIDNSAGLLPIAFTEVTLSRSLFRSGESEYRLNGQPCRLLDIQEVLSDTGVGREQHTIIGQGQLDAVLTADPIQMRGFIEEAAGVGKHRRRKERALRKIAGTEQNLVRLSDLLAEIRRQLRPLREQAEVAKRHLQLADEFGRVRLVIAARDLAQARLGLGDTAADLDAVIRIKETELSAVERRLIEAEAHRHEVSARAEREREAAWALARSQERLSALAKLAAERARTLDAELETRRAQVLGDLRDAERESAILTARAAVREDAASPQTARRIVAAGIEGVIGTLADLVDAPSQYEPILEALFGNPAGVVVVSDRQSAMRVLENLKSDEPVDVIVTEAAGNCPEADPLSKHVKFAGPHGEHPLAGIFIARDSAEAGQLASKYRDLTFVTLEGVVARGPRVSRWPVDVAAAASQALETAAAMASQFAGLVENLQVQVETVASVANRAHAFSGLVGAWAAEAEARYTASRGSLEELDHRIGELRMDRAARAGAVDDLRVKAREEDLTHSEMRIRARVLEERMREEWQCDPDETVAKYGHRWEVEDESRLTEPLDRLAASDDETLRRKYARLERDLAQMGTVNPLAASEFEALSEREDFLAQQIADVRASRRDLFKVVASVDEKIRDLFESAFNDVAREYEHLFAMLFPGGQGRLRLTEPNDLLASGVEVEARPGGKNLKRLSLLSGGERALSALAVLFAIFSARPSPFYILDEVEAALDDVNLHRFLGLLRKFRESSQLLVVTHQKRTMEAADVLYGVSIKPDGASRVISERLTVTSPDVEDLRGRLTNQL